MAGDSRPPSPHPSQADLTTAERTSAAEALLSSKFLRFSEHSAPAAQQRITGFGGYWQFFAPTSASASAVTSQFRCVRTYEVVETEPPLVNFRTFTEQAPANGASQRRLQDAIFESGYQRLASDTFFSHSMALSKAELAEGLPSCVYWRCVAIDSENVVRVAPGLPPKPCEVQSLQASQYPGWKPEHIALGVFAFEAFLQDGESRWSLGALYSVNTLQLLSHFCIRERLLEVDPALNIDFSRLTLTDPGPRLGGDTHGWLAGGAFRGEMREAVWDDEGEMLRLPPRPAKWAPPDPDSATHRLFLYEDGMYAYYPLELPAVEAGCDNCFASGARFEMGGQCKGPGEFRRLVLRYAPGGGITSLTKEVFRQDGHFDFDKRRSTSVRRSQDLRASSSFRRAASQAAPAPSPYTRAPELAARRTDARERWPSNS